jgi:hypothetical protein
MLSFIWNDEEYIFFSTFNLDDCIVFQRSVLNTAKRKENRFYPSEFKVFNANLGLISCAIVPGHLSDTYQHKGISCMDKIWLCIFSKYVLGLCGEQVKDVGIRGRKKNIWRCSSSGMLCSILWCTFTNISEVLAASEASVNFYHTTQSNIPEDRFYTDHRENLKCHLEKHMFLQVSHLHRISGSSFCSWLQH